MLLPYKNIWLCSRECHAKVPVLIELKKQAIIVARFNSFFFVSGVLVLNVTWRGKSFMGTMIDFNRVSEEHKWSGPK